MFVGDSAGILLAYVLFLDSATAIEAFGLME